MIDLETQMFDFFFASGLSLDEISELLNFDYRNNQSSNSSKKPAWYLVVDASIPISLSRERECP